MASPLSFFTGGFMLRFEPSPFTHWRDKTMTAIRSDQLDGIEDSLYSLSPANLFDDTISAEKLHELYCFSYYAAEEGDNRLYSVSELQNRVLSGLSEELKYLTTAEDTLLSRAVALGGSAELLDGDELIAADALVRRMLCYMSFSDDPDEPPVINVSEKVGAKVMDRVLFDEESEDSGKIFRFEATMHSLLYLAGFLYYEQPLDEFLREVCCENDKTTDEQRGINRVLAMRFLRAGFDYLEMDDGGLLLVHPGLAEPDKLVESMAVYNFSVLEFSSEQVVGGMNGILPEEKPSSDALANHLVGALRPEIDSPESAAEDIRLIIKQDASFEDLRSVLESMLVVMPTQEMLMAIKRMMRETPRWAGMKMAVVN